MRPPDSKIDQAALRQTLYLYRRCTEDEARAIIGRYLDARGIEPLDAEVEAAAKVLEYGQEVEDDLDQDYWRYKAREALVAANTASREATETSP